MAKRNGIDNEQNNLMGKFRPVVPRNHETKDYEVTVHYNGSTQRGGSLREKDAILTDLLDEIEFYFKNMTQNTYKGRLEIKIRLEEK